MKPPVTAWLDQWPPEHQQTVQDWASETSNNGNTPDGLTWHHHQDTGVMVLTDSCTHACWPHVGGGAIWGGRPLSDGNG